MSLYFAYQQNWINFYGKTWRGKWRFLDGKKAVKLINKIMNHDE